MREYETTLIIQPEISDEGVASICERVDGFLDKAGAIRLLYDDLGKRRLAYEIQNFQKGRYLTLHFLDAGTAIPELERGLRLEDSIIRFLTVQSNDFVEDVESRRSWAAEEERVRAEKAAEKAAREAEEAVRLEAEAEAARAAAAERAKKQAQDAAEAAASAPDAAEAGESAPDAAEAGESAPDAAEDASKAGADAEAPKENPSDEPDAEEGAGAEEASR